MLKKIKSLLSFRKRDDKYYTKCDCGGKLEQVSYISTIGNIDDEFLELWICKCNECNIKRIVKFQVET